MMDWLRYNWGVCWDDWSWRSMMNRGCMMNRCKVRNRGCMMNRSSMMKRSSMM